MVDSCHVGKALAIRNSLVRREAHHFAAEHVNMKHSNTASSYAHCKRQVG